MGIRIAFAALLLVGSSVSACGGGGIEPPTGRDRVDEFSCSGEQDCSCDDRAECQIGCDSGCGVVCEPGADCLVECAAGCATVCAAGAKCQLVCASGDCELGCGPGAECDLLCGDGSCVLDCAEDAAACNCTGPGCTCRGACD